MMPGRLRISVTIAVLVCILAVLFSPVVINPFALSRVSSRTAATLLRASHSLLVVFGLPFSSRSLLGSNVGVQLGLRDLAIQDSHLDLRDLTCVRLC